MTREDLRGIVEGITDEQLKKILDIHSSDIGKSKNESVRLREELETAKDGLAQMEQELGALRQGQCEAEEMKAKIEELQKVIDQNAQAAEQAIAEGQLSQRFDAVSRGRAFVNEITRRGVFDRFKAALAEADNAQRSDDEIYSDLTAALDNLYAPQEGIPEILGPASGFGGDFTEGDVRSIMGLN